MTSPSVDGQGERKRRQPRSGSGASQTAEKVPKRVRQAVVIVHGMGEQRPLDMLNKFIEAVIPSGRSAAPSDDPDFYSRPDEVTDSYESRRYLAPAGANRDGTERYAQTEFFEYHWAHLMQGNQLRDMWSTFRRMMLQWPWRVPRGLRGIWWIFWILVVAVAAMVWLFRADIDVGQISVNSFVSGIVGGGVVATVVTWLLTKFLPGKISSSFVDVVRYLDTSPRSYGVRKAIRKGILDLLEGLHETGRYQRIIIVAHSLGAYIAYDGITYLWTRMNQEHCAGENGEMDPTVRQALEAEARALLDEPKGDPTEFRRRQRALWREIRKQGCPWLITDFVTVGTPMYMADQLFTKNRKILEKKIVRREIATCPPQPDLAGPTPDKTLYSYPYGGGPVLYHAAPFAVVRWTNMWFPARFSFFGDWFGGPLGPLFGGGVLDIELTGNRPWRYLPAVAHSLYFSFPEDEGETSVTSKLRGAMDLASTLWMSGGQSDDGGASHRGGQG